MVAVRGLDALHDLGGVLVTGDCAVRPEDGLPGQCGLADLLLHSLDQRHLRHATSANHWLLADGCRAAATDRGHPQLLGRVPHQ